MLGRLAVKQNHVPSAWHCPSDSLVHIRIYEQLIDEQSIRHQQWLQRECAGQGTGALYVMLIIAVHFVHQHAG
jgi:hypothetical protein